MSELEFLVGKREEDIAEMENYLRKKEALIAELEAKIKANQVQPKQVISLPKGDLLDEMIG